MQGDLEPAVAVALFPGGHHAVESGRAIVQIHAFEQVADSVGLRKPPEPHQILTLHFRGRVHEAVGEIAVRREQQQTGRIDVQPTHDDPSAMRWRG